MVPVSCQTKAEVCLCLSVGENDRMDALDTYGHSSDGECEHRNTGTCASVGENSKDVSEVVHNVVPIGPMLPTHTFSSSCHHSVRTFTR